MLHRLSLSWAFQSGSRDVSTDLVAAVSEVMAGEERSQERGTPLEKKMKRGKMTVERCQQSFFLKKQYDPSPGMAADER